MKSEGKAFYSGNTYLLAGVLLQKPPATSDHNNIVTLSRREGSEAAAPGIVCGSSFATCVVLRGLFSTIPLVTAAVLADGSLMLFILLSRVTHGTGDG